jgi:hypothetical protein
MSVSAQHSRTGFSVLRERERHSVVNWYFSIFEKIFGKEKFNVVYLEKWYISGILEKNLQNPKFYHIFSPKNAILVSKIFGNVAAAVKSENQVTLKMGTRPTNLSAILTKILTKEFG